MNNSKKTLPHSSYSVTVYNNQEYFIESCKGSYYTLIENLYVPVEKRKQGLGRTFLKQAVKAGKAIAYELYIEASPDDAEVNEMPLSALIKFYESEGFSGDQETDRGLLMKYKEIATTPSCWRL